MNSMLPTNYSSWCINYNDSIILMIFRARFPSTSFGLWWSLFNLSFFATNMIGPGVANSWATEHGWQVAIQMPAVISMVVAFPLYFTNFDKPSDVGYEDQEIRGGKLLSLSLS